MQSWMFGSSRCASSDVALVEWFGLPRGIGLYRHYRRYDRCSVLKVCSELLRLKSSGMSACNVIKAAG